MAVVSILTVSLLFGGMALYTFGFAPFIFASLPMAMAGKVLRQAFPYYYLFIIITATIAMAGLWPIDRLGAALLATTAGMAIFARQILMPIVNFFKDKNEVRNFNRVHLLSVMLNTAQLAAVATVLVRMA